MSPLDRRQHERAMHETYLVIKTAQHDMGTRPVTGPFASPEVTLGPDGRPRAVVWNLGTREVQGVVTEFYSVPAGMAVRPENARHIGTGNPAIIPAGSSVTVTCPNMWVFANAGDVLLVTASHPQSDPVKAPLDPLADRHVGQMNYAWAGTYEGKLGGAAGGKVRVEIRPAKQGLYKVRVFVAVEGRLPSHPQVDRTMAPNGATFRWLEIASARKDDWELTIQDNMRMSVRCRVRYTDGSGRTEPDLVGAVERC